MKKMKMMLAVMCVGILSALFVQPVYADSPDRDIVTNTLGAVTWTNTMNASAFTLGKLKIDGILPVDATCVVKRVTREGFTNTIIAAGVIASGVFGAVDTNSTVFLKGDKLLISGAGTNTGSRALIEGLRSP